jgi:hypothetical protein
MLVPGADVEDITWHGEGARAFAVDCLAGNVGNMSATRRQRVKMLPILGQHACRCQHKNDPDTKILCQGLPTLPTYSVSYTRVKYEQLCCSAAPR